MPSIDYHNRIEKAFCEAAEEMGFLTADATYHSAYPEEVKQLLQDRWSPTALYIRAKADRILVHSEKPCELEFEVKCHETPSRHDIVVEAMPLAWHIEKSAFGIRCLYVHWDRYINRTVGFWADNRLPVRNVMLPGRWRERKPDLYGWYLENLGRFWPGRVIEIDSARGSNDPFAIIDSADADKMPGPRELLYQLLNGEG